MPFYQLIEFDVVIVSWRQTVTLFPFCLLSLQMTEKLQDMENEAMSKIVELEKQLMQKNKDLESIRVRLLSFHIHISSCPSLSSQN